ncbi:unnamed protein product, partial [marine sediment metagenome]
MATPGKAVLLPGGKRGLLAGGKAGLFNGGGLCTACCGYEVGDSCEYCTGDAPRYVTVVISGMEPCAGCWGSELYGSSFIWDPPPDLNGTHILEQTSGCIWRVVEEPSPRPVVNLYSGHECEGEGAPREYQYLALRWTLRAPGEGHELLAWLDVNEP